MENLLSLFVSGGDYSCIDYLHLDALTRLKKLHSLGLHEFGSVDLLPLAALPQLKEFSLLYAKRTEHIDVIGAMSQLDILNMAGLEVEDLNFLDRLPDSVQLELCGIYVRNGVDVEKWKRFESPYIDEISVGEYRWRCIDLSALEA